MELVDDGRPGDVVTEADIERWTRCVEIAERLMVEMPENVVSINRSRDRANVLSVARWLYRSHIPTDAP